MDDEKSSLVDEEIKGSGPCGSKVSGDQSYLRVISRDSTETSS
jgi:hypothetical protein